MCRQISWSTGTFMTLLPTVCNSEDPGGDQRLFEGGSGRKKLLLLNCMILSMLATNDHERVSCTWFWPWPITSRSFGHDFTTKILHLLSCPFSRKDSRTGKFHRVCIWPWHMNHQWSWPRIFNIAVSQEYIATIDLKSFRLTKWMM